MVVVSSAAPKCLKFLSDAYAQLPDDATIQLNMDIQNDGARPPAFFFFSPRVKFTHLGSETTHLPPWWASGFSNGLVDKMLETSTFI